MKKMKPYKRHTATKATSTPPIGMPDIAGHVYEPEAPMTSRPPAGHVAVNPDAPMHGNISGCCSKPVAMPKGGKKGMDY